jgi:branched-chain amino acid transport system substrate-binding protein
VERKVTVGIAFTLVLLATMLITPPTKGFVGQIKIGIIGPQGLPHWSPVGMKEGAEMAAMEINATGGIQLSDGGYEIKLVFANEYSYPTIDTAAAALEMERLCDPTQEGVDFVIGGFRTECTAAMIEVAADYGVPFFINGASTSALINGTVRQDYARYKYLFRVNPVNSTILFKTIAGALAGFLIPVKLLPIYGHDLGMGYPQVRVAVLAEDLEWTIEMYEALTNPYIYPYILGPNANVTYAGRIPDGTTNVSPWLSDVIDSRARLLIHIFSGITGGVLASTWRAMEVNATLVGINVIAQMQEYWANTGGACEYESILNFAGTRTPIVPGVTDVFWDKFVNMTGGWPLYTAWGAYDGIYMLKEALEAIGSLDKDALVAYFEDPSFERMGLNGKFKFDSYHDVYSNEYGPLWGQGYMRAMFVQWLSERMEVVCPVDQIYSKKWAIPPWMYPLQTDITYDGKVDITDIAIAAMAFGSYPGHTKWEKEADMNYDDKVDIFDIAVIAKDFGKYIELPLP